MSVNIDRQINNVENFLTNISRYPILGSLAGGVKIVFGVVQFALATVATIFITMTFIWICRPDFFEKSLTHLLHGAGNICAGIFETIPIVQSVTYNIRILTNNEIYPWYLYVYTNHGNKKIPYSSLVDADWFIGSAGNKDVDAMDKYERELRKMQITNQAPQTGPEKRKFAKTIIDRIQLEERIYSEKQSERFRYGRNR